MTRKTYRKKIVTDELISNINPENKALIEKFLKEKKIRCSDVTIKGYESDANIFFVWNLLHNDNKIFTDIRKLEFSNFFSFATETLRYGSARNNRLRSFLSSFSIFIEKFMDDAYPSFRNIVLKTIESVPKEVRREKTILSEEQITSLLVHLSKTSPQKACWLALAAYSGSRFSELLRFTTDSLDESHTAFGDLFIETKTTIKTKGRGRSGKMLHKYILKDKFLPYYRSWLVERERTLKDKNKDHLFLFIRGDGSPATDGTVRSWISEMEAHLGVNVYPHAFRHFLCTELTRKKIPQQFIQFLFGWSNAEVYHVYNDLNVIDTQLNELEHLKN